MPRNVESQPNPDESEQAIKEDSELKIRRGENRKVYVIGRCFDSQKDGAKRIEQVMLYVKPIIDSGLANRQEIEKLLEGCELIEDRKEFINAVLSALEPIFALKNQQRDEGIPPEQTNVNEVLNYEIKEDLVELHLPTTGVKAPAIRELYLEGLKKLARDIKDRDDITVIRADSWIIQKNPELIEKILEGFELLEGGLMSWSRSAIISKRDFIERYLK